MTPPGELNRRLVLEAPVESADGAGGVTRSYAPVMTLWAKVEPVSARGAVVADAPGATITHRIIIRRRSPSPRAIASSRAQRIYRIVPLRDGRARAAFS